LHTSNLTGDIYCEKNFQKSILGGMQFGRLSHKEFLNEFDPVQEICKTRDNNLLFT